MTPTHPAAPVSAQVAHPVAHLEPGALLNFLTESQAIAIKELGWGVWEADFRAFNKAGSIDTLIVGVWTTDGTRTDRYCLVAGSNGLNLTVGRWRGGKMDLSSLSASESDGLRATNPAFAYAYAVALEAQRRFDAARGAP